MATKEQLQEDTSQFQSAFNEEDSATPEMSEDEAFGLTPSSETADDNAGTGEAPAVAVVIEADQPDAQPTHPVETAGQEAAAGSAPTDTTAEAPAEAAPAAEFDAEKERQRLKSWEGRLKAMQADIDSKRGSESPAEEAAEESAEGEMSFDNASQALAQDFGDDFVQMIKAIARGEAAKAAGESVGEIGQRVESIIAHLHDSDERAHFERIFDAHEDFMDIADSPEFIEWLSQNPDYKETVESGSAREVIKMLNAYKASKTQAPAEDTGGDAAEGVRSSGLRLPDAPVASGDFANAWDEFPE